MSLAGSLQMWVPNLSTIWMANESHHKWEHFNTNWQQQKLASTQFTIMLNLTAFELMFAVAFKLQNYTKLFVVVS